MVKYCFICWIYIDSNCNYFCILSFDKNTDIRMNDNFSYLFYSNLLSVVCQIQSGMGKLRQDMEGMWERLKQIEKAVISIGK